MENYTKRAPAVITFLSVGILEQKEFISGGDNFRYAKHLFTIIPVSIIYERYTVESV